MSSGMNITEAEKIADKMSYREAIINCLCARCVPYRKATKIKMKRLLECIGNDKPLWKSDEHFIKACNESYQQGKADAEKRYQSEYDRQIDNEQEAFENGYDKGYQQGKSDALNIDLDTPMHFTNEQKAWVKKYIAINGERQRVDAIDDFANWLKEKGIHGSKEFTRILRMYEEELKGAEND